MQTIILTGGRGTVVGELVHMNPNYAYLVLSDGSETSIPTQLIARVVR